MWSMLLLDSVRSLPVPMTQLEVNGKSWLEFHFQEKLILPSLEADEKNKGTIGDRLEEETKNTCELSFQFLQLFCNLHCVQLRFIEKRRSYKE